MEEMERILGLAEPTHFILLETFGKKITIKENHDSEGVDIL